MHKIQVSNSIKYVILINKVEFFETVLFYFLAGYLPNSANPWKWRYIRKILCLKKKIQKSVLSFLGCFLVQFVTILYQLLCAGQEEMILNEKIENCELAKFLEKVSAQISRCSKCS